MLQLVGPFGTESNPVIVESIANERIIGCPGNCDSGDTRTSNELRSELKNKVCPAHGF